MSYSDVVLANTPDGYWQLSAASGTSETDQTGNGNTMTIGSSVTLNQTPLLATMSVLCSKFPGTASDANAKLSRSTASFNYSGTSAASFEVWFKLAGSPDSTFRRLWTFTDGSDVQGFFCGINSSGLSVIRNTGSDNTITYAAGGTLAAGIPHHLVHTFDGASGSLYLDNVLVAGPTAQGGSMSSLGTSTKTIGNNQGSNRIFNGHLAHFAAYPTSLSASTIAAHYTAGTLNWKPSVSCQATNRGSLF